MQECACDIYLYVMMYHVYTIHARTVVALCKRQPPKRGQRETQASVSRSHRPYSAIKTYHFVFGFPSGIIC